MLTVQITPELRAAAPDYKGAFLEATVTNSPTPQALWDEVERLVAELRAHYDTTTVKDRAGIRATREAYKRAGKDPSRYRPSCEQLCRRVLQGKDLYSIDALVDIGNAVSMTCGYTVAVVDRERIEGDLITLGIGREGEPYEAIGRGPLNIASMPVFRDAAGGFATPTSDNVRTQCSEATRRVLIIINCYDGDDAQLEAAISQSRDLLTRYAEARDFELWFA